MDRKPRIQLLNRILSMKSSFTLASLAGCFILIISAEALQPPTDLPLPLVGTADHGHAYPGAIVPFGLVQLSPDTPIEGWDGCSGYHYSDSAIRGFSLTHLAGT